MKYEIKIILTYRAKGSDFYMKYSSGKLNEEEKSIIDAIGRRAKIFFENEIKKLEDYSKRNE